MVLKIPVTVDPTHIPLGAKQDISSIVLLHPQVKVRYQRLPDGEEEKDIMIV